MTQRNRRAETPKNDNRNKSKTLEASVLSLPENLAADLARYWKMFAAAPIQSGLGFLAFIPATVVPAVKFLTGGSDGSAGSSSGITGGVQSMLTASVPMKLLTALVFACSIGWTWAVVASWLTARRRDGFWLLSLAIATFSGVFVSSWSAGFLIKDNNNAVGVNMNMALLLVTACICASTTVAKTKFKMTRESDPVLIEQRAMTLMVFSLAAVAVALFVLASSPGGGGR